MWIAVSGMLALIVVSNGAAIVEDLLRPAFHFMPQQNWMNDPNGPMLYKGLYHLFFQHNPDAPLPANISWGHAVSKDLINWGFLRLALQPDKPYDQNGAFSGSITFVRGVPTILYTGSALNLDQSQNEAVPADLSDPLVRRWRKLDRNPIIFPPPPGVSPRDFRDPTNAWIGRDGLWRILVGAKQNTTGVALLYRSSDFVNWTAADQPLHQVAQTGMWECPDFYPVLSSGSPRGLEDSTRGPGTKHVLKVSLDDTRLDAYAVGTYNAEADEFVPDAEELDTGKGLVYDGGVFYASKTFFDYATRRRILWGWVTEKDTVEADIAKGWAGLQALPRLVWLDSSNGNAIKQWPVKEVESLRKEIVFSKTNLELQPGTITKVSQGSQLDIVVSFNLGNQTLVPLNSSLEDAQGVCNNTSTTIRQHLGPFGLLVLASTQRTEQTAIYFVLVRSGRGWKPVVCNDIRSSSLSSSVTKTTYGSFVNVTQSESHLSLRVIVDRSIVEVFAQGGKACLTSRVYPTLAVRGAANVFVFNNGSLSVQLEHVSIWRMKKANFHTLEKEK